MIERIDNESTAVDGRRSVPIDLGGGRAGVKEIENRVSVGLQNMGSTGNTHMRPAVRKMMALMRPTIHSSLPVPAMPNSSGKDKLAPLDPVWSQPCVAAPMAQRAIEYHSMAGPCHLWSLSYASATRSSSGIPGVASNLSGSRATSAARPKRSACSLSPLASANSLALL